MPTLLLLMLLVPLAAAALVAFLGPQKGDAIRQVSLGATLVALACGVILAVNFVDLPASEKTTTFQPVMVPGARASDPHNTTWTLLRLLPGGAQGSKDGGSVQFFVGLDGLNVWLVMLTAVLMVSSVLVSWTSIRERVNEYYAWLLVLETGMIGVFLAFDIILFYVFFELTLVPLFFLIGIWGGPEKRYAARKFFIYTLAGSLITLLGVLGIVVTLYQDPSKQELTFSIPRLVELSNEVSRQLPKEVADRRADLDRALRNQPGVVQPDTPREETLSLRVAEERLEYWKKVQFWVFVAMMCGFAIKVPLVPVHTWLPLAHVEAPTAGSVLLAGVLLKIGTYGFLRLCVPLAPDASLSFGAPVIGTLAVIGIIYGAFCALAQDDIKKLVAYSSVSHLGFCMLGLFALNKVGLTGGLLQMINHGLSTGALFLLVGMLYERYHTRRMGDYGGMAVRLKLLALFFVFITMSSIGLPGLNGFWGELSVLLGMYAFRGWQLDGRVLASLACAGVVLGAWYMLTLVRRVFFGPVREPHADGHGAAPDLNGREVAALAPIALLCLVLGLIPQSFLNTVERDLNVVARIAEDARTRAEPATESNPVAGRGGQNAEMQGGAAAPNVVAE